MVKTVSRRPLSWASFSLGLAVAAAAGAALLRATPPLDTNRTAAVSFAGTRDVTLFDVITGQTVRDVHARAAPRDIALAASGGRLVVASASMIESFDLADAANRRAIAVPGADRIATGSVGNRVYSARTRPTGVAALELQTTPAVAWTTALAGRVRTLVADERSNTILAGYSRSGGQVVVLDAASGTVRRTVTTGSPPVGLALTQDGRVADAVLRNGMLTAIGVPEGSHGRAIYLARRPSAPVLSPDDTTLYVLDAATRAVLVVERATFAVQGTIELPAKPYDMAISPDGSRLLVTSPVARSVYVIDARTLHIAQTLRFRRPPQRVVCARRQPRTPPSTPSAQASAMPAATFTAIAIRTPTATRTPVGGGGQASTPTATPVLQSSPSTPSAQPSATPAATLTAIAMRTPTTTRTPVGGEGQASTPTATPVLQSSQPGVAVGAVFDDGSAQPLADVLVQTGGGTLTATDPDGRYVASGGPSRITLIKDGYTRGVRPVSVPPDSAAHVLDMRLTRLAPAQAVGPGGGVVTTTYPLRGGGVATVELAVTPGALSEAADVQLTVLSPQGLSGPLPLGWSVLLGVDLRATGAAAAAATLRVPLFLLGPAMSLPVNVAVWDDGVAEWRAAGPGTVRGNAVEIHLATLTAQLALVVPDAIPTPPPVPLPGAPLRGVTPSQLAVESALVIADPDVVVAGAAVEALVQTSVRAVAPVPSGSRLQVDVRESYELRDGRQLAGTASRQDLLAYQLSPDAPQGGGAGTALGASFRLEPSRSFAIGELTEGHITIDALLPQDEGPLGVVAAAGGEIAGPGQLRLRVPPGATDRTTVIALQPATAADLPAGIALRPDLVGAWRLDIIGGPVDPTAAYAISLDPPVPDGQRFVLARVVTVDLQSVPSLAAFGHSQSGRVVVNACPAELGVCLAGLTGSGTYALFVLPTGALVVNGTVADDSGVRPGLVVQSDTTAVVSVTNPSGRYVLAVPPGIPSTLTSYDRGRDLSGQARVGPTAPSQILTADIELRPTAPAVVQVAPPNHGSGVAADATIALTFSEAIAPSSVTAVSVQLAHVGGATTSPLPIRASLSTDGMRLLLSPGAPLAPNALYRLTLTDAVTDRTGTGLLPFESDFTTAARFAAEALPPNTLRLSLPEPDGRVVVCGGAQLAFPGTFVTIINDTSGTTSTGVATDRSGSSGSDVCDTLFPGRCDTTQAGSFCAVVDAGFGDKILVQVEDALHNSVTLDAGLMRDAVTGVTAVGPDGGAVYAVDDPRYRLDVPAGAFDAPTATSITRLTADDVPHTADATLLLVGAVFLDLGGQTALKELHLSVPAPLDATDDDQFVATKVVNERGVDELTVIDTASVDFTTMLLTTNSPPFAGVLESGVYALHRAGRCLAWVSGFASTITNLLGQPFGTSGFIPGRVDVPFFLHGAQSARFTVPVPCDEPVQLTLNALTGQEIDSISLSTAPRKGEFVFLDEFNGQGLFADKTAPEVIRERTSIPDAATNVGHDAEISVPFTEPVLTSSLTPNNVKLLCAINGHTVEMRGEWSQSKDGKRIFFVPVPGSPQRGLPFGAHCRVRVSGVKDVHGNVMRNGPFEMAFDTFQPAVINRETGFDARAVDAMGWHSNRDGAKRQYVTFAEGTGHRPDWAGGLLIVDHTSLSSAMVTDEKPTAGLDRAVRFIAPEDFHDRDNHVFHGPYLMSLDGIGDESSRDRFGVWRLFDLASFPLVSQIASRIINHSADSFEHCNSLDPGTLNLCNHALHSVPNDIGVPLSVASVGAQVAYIVDAPFIGLEAIQLNDIDRSGTIEGVDGLLPGHFRAVDTLKGWVIGRRPDALIIRPPSLDQPALAADIPLEGGGLALTTLKNWPVDVDGNGNIDSDEKFDLVVTSAVKQLGGASTPVLYVVAVDTRAGTFAPRTLEGLIALPPGSQPFRIYPDPERRLLYVANGTVGLTIVDFQNPQGSLDEDGGMDLIDDRVLGSVSLEGAIATDVATDITLDTTANGVDRSGRVVGYVAAQKDGWFWVDLGPGRMETKLVGYADDSTNATTLVEPAAVRYFNEHRTALYQVEAKIPNHLTDLYPTVDVRVEAVDWEQEQPITVPTPITDSPFPPVNMQLAPAAVTVQLTRVPGTNRYTMPRDAGGRFTDVVVTSNLPIDELNARMQDKFPQLQYHAVYGGIGTKLKLTAQVAGTWLQGKVRTVPLEKIDVIILGIDGLRQDVLYPDSENDVQEPGVNYHIDPLTLTGIGQVLGGMPSAGGGVSGNLDRHHLRMRGVSAIFPSITLASWASIFTGQPPGVTGILGNEFFIRPPAPNLPFQKSGGIVTLSEGAFDRNNAENLGLTPPGSGTYLSDPTLTAQNNPGALLAPTIFEQLRTGTDPYLQALRDRYQPDGQGGTKDDLSIVAFNHYARGAARWLTMTDSQKNTLFPLTVLPGVREGWPLDKIPSDNLVDYLNRSLRMPPVPNVAGGLPVPGDRNDRPFPALTTLYLAGVDHDAHGGHGVGEAKYKKAVTGGPLGTSADGYVGQVVKELRSLGEFYNKIFILTADHGHTRITDDPDEFMPCALQEPANDFFGGRVGNNWLEAMGDAKKRGRETDQNNNMHIWELARIIAHGSAIQSVFTPRLLVPGNLGGLTDLGERWKSSVTERGDSVSSATLVAALNGTMAHLYVRPSDSAGWSVRPTEKELGAVAEVLRLFLMNGAQFEADGRRTFAGTNNADFGVIDEQAQLRFLDDINLPRLIGAVDFILVRLNDEYVLFNGLAQGPVPSATPSGPASPTPSSTLRIQSLPLSTLASATDSSGRERYVRLVERVEAMNHLERSGDLVLIMRNDTSGGLPTRCTTGVACRGWHASLNRSDSYVPLISSYPGGNRIVLEQLLATSCSPTGSADCRQNKAVPSLIRTILEEEYTQ